MAKTLLQRLGDVFRDTPASSARTDIRPFVIFADQVDTMNRASAEALSIMCKNFAEQGVKVHIVCQSQEVSSVLEEHFNYWQEGGELREQAFQDNGGEIWHVRGEAGADAFLEKYGKSLSGYLKVQDVPNLHHRANTFIVRPGQLAESKSFAAVKAHIDRATGALERENSVYRFIGPKVDGHGHDVYLLGGKGAGLAHMARQGIPVPSGFTISTEASRTFLREDKLPPQLMADEIRPALSELETYEARRLGDPEHPLYVSVRSGAPMSMPGMMDTVLNVGMNDAIAYRQAKKWAEKPEMVASIYDTYGRFLSSYSKAVISPELPEGKRGQVQHVLNELAENMQFYRYNLDTVDIDEIRALCREMTAEIQKISGKVIPQDPHQQMHSSIESVMKSWNSERAIAYRQEHCIPDDLGTAVTVQTMVMGNHPYRSGAGVLFSRNVSNGEPRLSGNYMPGGQGEDVVSGSRGKVPHLDALREVEPQHYEALRDIAISLELEAGRAQEIEFCVEQGELYVLQVRNAKCTPEAEVRIALDMAEAEIANAKNSLIVQDIDEAEIYRDALEKIDQHDLGRLMGTRVAPQSLADTVALTQGESVCSSATNGIAVFSQQDLLRERNAGRNAIFISSGSLTDDYESVNRASGTLVIGGNPSSHAAVVARSMGKPYVCSLEGELAENAFSFTANNGDKVVIQRGDEITIAEDGSIYQGLLPLEQKPISENVQRAIDLDAVYRDGTYSRIVQETSRTLQASPEIAPTMADARDR